MNMCSPRSARLVVLTIAAFVASQMALAAQQPQPTDANVNTAQTPVDSGSFLDEMVELADRTQIMERLSGDIDGWYPRLGGMTRGSGFALGPGALVQHALQV